MFRPTSNAWLRFLTLLIVSGQHNLIVRCQTYDNTADIFTDVLVNSGYNTEVRPLLNQSKIMKVSVGFEIVSIVEVNDVSQSFICNGFLAFSWIDEKLRWNASMYGGQNQIHPVPDMIWRPRVILMNTLGDRDLFGDDKAPITVQNNGFTIYIAGGLFPTSCDLHMDNFPYDQQTCIIKIVAMSLSVDEMLFETLSTGVRQSFYTENGEWEIINGFVHIGNLSSSREISTSSAEITFVLKRRPFFFLVNILLPVVFLSFLNILVFIIPVDSGEKIGYGITVLLALSVFLSIVSEMIPRSSLTIPKVTIYVFLLLIISMLTVIDSIVIVYLQHKEESEEKHQNAKENFRSAFTKVRTLQRAVSPLEPALNNGKPPKSMCASAPDLNQQTHFNVVYPQKVRSQTPSIGSVDEVIGHDHDRHVNKYKLIGRHIDQISFLFFFILWLAVTLGFIFSMSLS